MQNRVTRALGGVPLDRRRVLLGLAAVGGFLAVDFGAILYARGWLLDGERLTPPGFMAAFKRVYGFHPGFRRNHHLHETVFVMKCSRLNLSVVAN